MFRIFTVSSLIALLVGCGGADITGTWVGDCDYSAFGYETTYIIYFDVEDTSRKSIEGEGGMADGNYLGDLEIEEFLDLGAGYLGALDGSKKKNRVEIYVVDIGAAQDLEVDIEIGFEGKAKKGGDVLSGECVVGSGGFRIRKDMEMERL